MAREEVGKVQEMLTVSLQEQEAAKESEISEKELLAQQLVGWNELHSQHAVVTI